MSISIKNETTHNFWNGHALEILQMLPDEIFNCAVTSPPYWGLRDYGLEPQVWDGEEGCEHEWGDEIMSKANDSNRGTMEWTTGGNPAAKIKGEKSSQGSFCLHCGAWRGSLGLEPTPELYVKHLTEIFREVRRVLKKDGTLWLNLGSSYMGSGGAHKEHHANPGISKSFERGGYSGGTSPTRLRSNVHPYDNDVKFNFKPKDMIPLPWMVAMALQHDGWYLRSDIIWSKPNPMPESVRDRPTKAHEYMFLLSKNRKYYFDQDAVKEKAKDWGTRNRANFRGGTSDKFLKHNRLINANFAEKGRNIRSVWPIPDELWNQFMQWYSEQPDSLTDVWHLSTRPFKGAHFAVFPPDLVRPCILAGCPENGTVLDPFSGAGTVAVVCKELNRNSVGIELNPEYIKMSKERTEYDV